MKEPFSFPTALNPESSYSAFSIQETPKIEKDRCLSTENVFKTPKGLLYTEMAPNSEDDDVYDSNDELEMHIKEDLSHILANNDQYTKNNPNNIINNTKVDIGNLAA
jgi:hypothetical protein